MKRLLLFALLVITTNAVNAQSWHDTVNIINKIFDRYKPEHPGCQLAISRNGKVIFSNAWGMADLEDHVAYTTETVTEAGSISKQFVAASILILEQQGKLSLNDDVRKYLPQLPDYGATITLENLLHHTSGLREWSNLAAITGWPRTTKAYRNEDVLNMLCHQEKLNNVPGTEYIYSNSNYILLTLIVEKVSGIKLADFTHQYIFTPAGMLHTSWRDDYKKVVANRGTAYAKKSGKYEINMPNENVYGPGGLLTTTEDLLKWNEFYLSGKLGGQALLEKQLAIVKIPGGQETDYAAGLFVDSLKGFKVIYHDGQTAGYVGFTESFPQLKLSIAWLCNTTEFKDSLFDDVAAVEGLFVKAPTTAPSKANAVPPVVSTGILKKYTGWYSSQKTNHGIKVTLKRDTLLLENIPLIPINNTDFGFKESIVRFTLQDGFVLTTADKRTLQFKKQNNNSPNPDYLDEFTGTYNSKETESNFTVVIKDGALMLEKVHLRDVILSATYNDAFNFSLDLNSNLYPEAANVLFERDNKNKVIGCVVSMDDARGIVFTKVR